MNKKYLLAVVASTLMFAACGDDVTEVNEIHQDGMAVLEAGEKLSEQACDTTNVGEMLFVMDSSEAFICDGESWQTLKGEKGEDGAKGDPGKDGDNGTGCTSKSVTNAAGLEGVEVTCGETVIDTIWNGKDGEKGADGKDGDNGTGCTSKSVKNKSGIEGLEVTCGETVIDTIWNGKDGENGKPGDPGKPGDAGTSCTAKSVKNAAGLEGVEVTCGETVVDTIWNGKNGKDGEDGNDGTSCTAEPVKNAAGLEGLEVTCGETVIDTIWNGKDGQNGNNGTSCIAEPVKNAAGLKGLEVTCGETVIDTIWNGKDGENGNNGTSCTATVNQDGGFDLVCDGQTVGTIKNGEDGVGCTLDDEGDGKVTVTCGKGSAMTTTILYKAVCGTKPYDPAKAFCSEGKLYSCDDEPYDPAKSFCSEGELFSCDDKPYDPKKQYCLEVTRDGSDIYSVEELLTDARDKQIYKTVKICNDDETSCQIWMAENLNYSVNSGAQSWCGGGSGTTEGDCSVYGRLYTWAAAMDSVAAFSNDGKGCGYGAECDPSGTVRGVCPEGWHLPSKDEWETLFAAVGGSSKAGTALKSQTGWKSQTGGADDRDAYGFSALPAGNSYDSGYFNNAGIYANFWSASEYSSDFAYRMYLLYNGEFAFMYYYDKYDGFSVRCLQNN